MAFILRSHDSGLRGHDDPARWAPLDEPEDTDVGYLVAVALGRRQPLRCDPPAQRQIPPRQPLRELTGDEPDWR